MEDAKWDPRELYKIVGMSKEITQLRAKIKRYCDAPLPVIITGETGSGKELIAQNLHHLGVRAKGPFVEVNCAGLAESLLEGELYGHEKNAFTGASKTGKPGKIEEVHGGTLFLDEVGELTHYGQRRFLRVLGEQAVTRIGSSHRRDVDFRLIAATNIDIEYALADGTIREDFYYRIRGIPIEVPALRERREDIPLLIQYFASKYEHKTGRAAKPFDPAAMMLLMDYKWPGNVRQLETAVYMAMYNEDEPTVSRETIEELIAGYSVNRGNQAQKEALATRGFKIGMTFEDFEAELLRVALESTHGNQRRAAEALGMSYNSFRHYYRKHNLGGNSAAPAPSNGNGNGEHPAEQPIAETPQPADAKST